jgi:putative intracellular protease/amidase
MSKSEEGPPLEVDQGNAPHVVVDGRLVTGQNQNAGAEVANLMMKAAGGTRR